MFVMLFATHEIVGKHPGPHLLIIGGVHGDEFEPMAAIRRLMTSISPDLLHGKLTLVPVVNEPAFRLGQRVGDDGLDLARTCPGRPDGSMTERIAHDLSQLIRSCDLMIDLHTGGTRLVVLPLSGYMLHPDAEILERQRRMARAFGLPLVWGTDYRFEGRSLSVARDAKVPAIYCEYEGGGRLNPEGTTAYFHGCLSVMSEFGLLASLPKIVGEPKWVVEDTQQGSGQMQTNHPTTTAGFFDPKVKLGDYIHEGDELGVVLDVLGKQAEVIRARYSGMVIVLHTFARIEAGVSVGVILDTSSGSSWPD